MKQTVPLLCVKDPLETVKPLAANNVSDVLVNAVPEIEKAPLETIFTLPPTNVPELSVAPLEPIVNVKVLCLKVPV